jgi:hypothetical protein
MMEKNLARTLVRELATGWNLDVDWDALIEFVNMQKWKPGRACCAFISVYKVNMLKPRTSHLSASTTCPQHTEKDVISFVLVKN